MLVHDRAPSIPTQACLSGSPMFLQKSKLSPETLAEYLKLAMLSSVRQVISITR